MKKFSISVSILLATLISSIALNAQCVIGTPIKYTNGSGTGVAPFTIDGLITDWETHILGPGTGNAVTPFNPPLSSASNFSLDGTDAIGPDLDVPTPPRDLRFFAFTFDDYNVYFYFRRINNSNSQNTFMYCMDINADGFMNNGEPVIRANFNSSGISAFAIHPYIVNVSVDYVAGKGNYMTKPTAPNQGLADGYSVSGSFGPAVTTGVIPIAGPQVFAAENTEAGFGTEFAVPWTYLRNWINPLSQTPLQAGDVFTYHVLTQNGTGATVTSGATDNAGGCCSGLAVVGQANVTTDNITLVELVKDLKYRARIKMKNNSNAPAGVTFEGVELNTIVQYLNRPIDETGFVIEVYADANGNGVIDGTDASTLKTLTYATGDFNNQPIIYTSPDPDVAVTAAPLGGFGHFIVDISLPVNKSVKSLQAVFNTAGILDLPVGPCEQLGTPSQAQGFIPLATTLPVTFKSFTAARNRSNVLLKWETLTELNNAGFMLQRNIGGTWEDVAFIPSVAANGNSEALLVYTYNDLNPTKGITQYRLEQVDLDGKAKLSDTRAVRGDGQIGKTIVFPNPSTSGNMSIVFEDANVKRDVAIIDMTGKIIKQWRNVTNNNLQVENLPSGLFTVRILAVETGEQVVEKIVVNRR